MPSSSPSAASSSSSSPKPVPLTPERREEAIEILATAFAEDPLILWMSRDPRFPYAVFEQVIDPYLHSGVSWILDNGAGVLLAAPPDMPKPRVDFNFGLLWKMLRQFGWRTMLRGIVYELYSAHFPPREPHYYAYAMGVRAEFRGQGLGTRLMRTLLDLGDADQVPVYLESAHERNLSLYYRLGYRLLRETRVPLGGPRMWLMLYEPRSASRT
ncbi:MAG: GNAT family N-acetyltransferase [Chloroflexi bacterium]|nr:GNAT family N-acetyltransferase [Chloroflexota bacterium]